MQKITTPKYVYDYTALDQFLSSESDPLEICDQLEECHYLLMKEQTECPAAFRLDVFHTTRRLCQILRVLKPLIESASRATTAVQEELSELKITA